ncbi:hypothetical protein OH764_31850 [Burkholderia sp. M6-3]
MSGHAGASPACRLPFLLLTRKLGERKFELDKHKCRFIRQNIVSKNVSVLSVQRNMPEVMLALACFGMHEHVEAINDGLFVTWHKFFAAA